jgi:PAS domain S-box-containing protein
MGDLWPVATVVAVYAAFSAAWIIFSDEVLLAIVQDPQQLTRWQHGKGVAFVAFSSLLLAYLLKRVLAQRDRVLHQLRAANLALEAGEERYRLTVDNMLEGFQIVGFDWRYLYVNDAAARHGRQTKDALLGRTMMEAYPGIEQTAVFAALRRCMEARVPQQIENEFSFADGTRGWFDLSIQPVPQGIFILSMDITERKRAEESLHALSQRLQQIREEERTGIARELHDQLGQALTGLKLDLSWMERKLERSTSETMMAPLRDKMAAMARSIDAAVQTVRRISSELRPGVLDDLGLLPAIEWQAQEFQSRTGIRCRLSAPAEPPALPPTHSTALFRIFQEALTNVARHARATGVEVRLAERDGVVQLEIADNGRGITPAEVAGTRSLGLLGMRERAAAIGGEVRVEGGPGEGTRVIVRIPSG